MTPGGQDDRSRIETRSGEGRRDDEARIYEGLATVFREVFAREIALSPGLSADQVPGWDSFKQVRLVLQIEEHFGIQLHIRDVNAMKNVGGLVRILAAKQDGGAA